MTWWWGALAAITAAIGLAIRVGPSNLTTAAALVAFALVVLALILDDSPRDQGRRPW